MWGNLSFFGFHRSFSSFASQINNIIIIIYISFFIRVSSADAVSLDEIVLWVLEWLVNKWTFSGRTSQLAGSASIFASALTVSLV